MLTAAFAQAVKDLCLKQSMSGIGAVPAIVVVWAYCLTTTLFLCLVVGVEGVPALTPGFWWALLATGPLAACTLYLYVRSLELSDLSLTVPMLATTPLFLLATSPLMLGEFPDPGGLAGIVCIVAGSYLLNISRWRKGPLEPFKALLRQRGPRLMLVVAFLWSISGNIDKIGLRHSSPVFWITCAYGITTLFLTPVVWRSAGRGFAQVWTKPWYLLATGLLEAVTAWCQMYALTMTLVPYVISVKRLSAVIAVLLGGIVLREKKLRERLLGSTLMVAGVFLIAFFG